MNKEIPPRPPKETVQHKATVRKKRLSKLHTKRPGPQKAKGRAFRPKRNSSGFESIGSKKSMDEMERLARCKDLYNEDGDFLYLEKILGYPVHHIMDGPFKGQMCNFVGRMLYFHPPVKGYEYIYGRCFNHDKKRCEAWVWEKKKVTDSN